MCTIVLLYIIFCQFRPFLVPVFSHNNGNCLIDTVISQRNKIRSLNIQKRCGKIILTCKWYYNTSGKPKGINLKVIRNNRSIEKESHYQMYKNQ